MRGAKRNLSCVTTIHRWYTKKMQSMKSTADILPNRQSVQLRQNFQGPETLCTGNNPNHDDIHKTHIVHNTLVLHLRARYARISAALSYCFLPFLFNTARRFMKGLRLNKICATMTKAILITVRYYWKVLAKHSLSTGQRLSLIHIHGGTLFSKKIEN